MILNSCLIIGYKSSILICGCWEFSKYFDMTLNFDLKLKQYQSYIFMWFVCL